MPAFNVLYYPSWNPPVKWFRSMLLFFDRVEVIRPKDVCPQYDPANEDVFNLVPHVFGEIKRHQYEMQLNVRNKEILKNAFGYIAQTLAPQKKKVKVRVFKDGNISVPGYSRLHVSKIPPYVSHLLEKYSLINHHAEKILEETKNTEGFHIVESNASNLVLSLIADYYSKEKSLRSFTNKPIGYIVNALNTNSIGRKESAAMSLASSILRIEVPDNIETLEPKQYVSLRNRYEDIREPFQHTVRTLCDDYQLAQINTKKQFKDAVHNATRDFCLETEKLRKKKWAKCIKNWSVMGFGVLSSFCSLGAGTIVILGSGISAGLHIYQSFSKKSYTTEKRRAQQLLGTLKGELDHPILLRRIAGV